MNNIPALVQIMAWHRPGDKPLSEPMLIILLTHVCVTWPQWVNTSSDCFWWHVAFHLLSNHIFSISMQVTCSISYLAHIHSKLHRKGNYNNLIFPCRSTVFPNGTLLLHDVQLNDVGSYKCVGISDNGPAQAYAATLILACKWKLILHYKGTCNLVASAAVTIMIPPHPCEVIQACSEIQNYLLPYGSLGPTDHDPHGSQSTGNGSHHW